MDSGHILYMSESLEIDEKKEGRDACEESREIPDATQIPKQQ